MHGFYVAQLRRRIGVTAVREFARHRLRRAAYVGVPRAVVEQMMQQEAMRVRLHGQPAAEPPYQKCCEGLYLSPLTAPCNFIFWRV